MCAFVRSRELAVRRSVRYPTPTGLSNCCSKSSTSVDFHNDTRKMINRLNPTIFVSSYQKVRLSRNKLCEKLQEPILLSQERARSRGTPGATGTTARGFQFEFRAGVPLDNQPRSRVAFSTLHPSCTQVQQALWPFCNRPQLTLENIVMCRRQKAPRAGPLQDRPKPHLPRGQL